MVSLAEISFAYLEVECSSEMKQEPNPPILPQNVSWQAWAWGLAWGLERVPLGYLWQWESQPRAWEQGRWSLVALEWNPFARDLPHCLLGPRPDLPCSRGNPRASMSYADEGWDPGRLVSAIRGHCESRQLALAVVSALTNSWGVWATEAIEEKKMRGGFGIGIDGQQVDWATELF